jgi:hypothetical protein
MTQETWTTPELKQDSIKAVTEFHTTNITTDALGNS